VEGSGEEKGTSTTVGERGAGNDGENSFQWKSRSFEKGSSIQGGARLERETSGGGEQNLSTEEKKL